jgi:hypothetical protein
MRQNQAVHGTSKHQHWVPQFYLRYFATMATRNKDCPQVWIFSKDPADGDEKLTNIRNVCGKRYLYAPVQVNGERDWSLDKRLDDLESSLGQVWSELAEDYVDFSDPELRKGLAQFIAVMYLRNPETRIEVEQLHSELVAFFENAPKCPDCIAFRRKVGTNTELGGNTSMIDFSRM